MSLSSGEFARRVMIVGAIAAVAILLWRLIEVVLLIFAGVILAVALVSLSRWLMRYVPLGRRWMLALVICLMTIGILGSGALLVAFTVGPWHVLEVIGLFLAIHVLEGYILVPAIQKWAVALPPALALTAVVMFGLLFGPLGIILAHPLMVCAMVAVEELYVRHAQEVT